MDDNSIIQNTPKRQQSNQIPANDQQNTPSQCGNVPKHFFDKSFFISFVLVLFFGSLAIVFTILIQQNKFLTTNFSQIRNFLPGINFLTTKEMSVRENLPKKLTAISISPTIPVDIVTSAWNVYQNSLIFVKNHNMEGIRNLLYKPETISSYYDTCLKKSGKQQCETEIFEILELFYDPASSVQRLDLTHTPYDNKQLIMYSDPKLNTNGGYDVTRIYFIIEHNSPKILLIQLANYGQLQDASDTDQDGITDYEEKCERAHKYNTTCVKSDPNNKDSNGNGWWDGTEAEMNPSP